MYRILIVDDEELVRKAILQKIDWQALGFGSVDEAEDGELALEFVRKNQPDVVLTDVRMPFMDGLDLARHLSEEFPDILVVMLSGHDEFEYVQEAMRSRVFEYLLKPISAAGLTEMLTRLTIQLDHAKKERELMLQTREQLRQSLPLLRERFFHRLISRPLSTTETARVPTFLDLQTNETAYLVCVFQIDQPVNQIFGGSAEDQELLDLSASNIILELVGSNGTVFNDMDNRPVIIFYGDDTNNRRLTLARSALLNAIRSNLTQALRNSWSIGIGRHVSRFGDIAVSYQAALEVLSYRLIYGCDRIFDSRDFTQPKTSFFFPTEVIHDLISRLKLEDPAIVQLACAEFFLILRSQDDLSAENARIVLNDLINNACRTALEILSNETISPIELYSIQQQVSQTETLQEIEPLVTQFLSDICNRIRKQQASHNHSLIFKARRFIEKSYTNEDLGLNEVAEHVAVSSCYLSILFKRETDETFTEYLTRVRMEKAKELLRTTDLKAYQIAAQIGYTDPHYFSQCFKKYTGLNPTQYKTGSGDTI
jgi:two-component system response regulator YesN